MHSNPRVQKGASHPSQRDPNQVVLGTKPVSTITMPSSVNYYDIYLVTFFKKKLFLYILTKIYCNTSTLPYHFIIYSQILPFQFAPCKVCVNVYAQISE